MRHSPILTHPQASITTPLNLLDKRDTQIVELLLARYSNKAIAAKLKIPLSTVQRRTRKLFEQGIMSVNYELNYRKLGLRKGLLHVYVKDTGVQSVAQRIASIPGVQSVSIHIGNSDVVAEFTFKETNELLAIITECKKLNGVEKIFWSEEVMNVGIDNGDAKK